VIVDLTFFFFLQSLIDLAGSEKATSDKERTREGKYINTRCVLCITDDQYCVSRLICVFPFSLLTLGSVIGTLAENAAKGKRCVPFCVILLL